MPLNRRLPLVPGLLTAVWLLVVGWQVQEHARVLAAARADLRNRAHEIASTLSAVTRALRFRGALFQDRLEPVLNELVSNHTNAIVNANGLLALALLNPAGDPVVTAGDPNLFTTEKFTDSECWQGDYATFVLPVAGASVGPEGATNEPTVVLPPIRNLTNNSVYGRDFSRREPRSGETNINFSTGQTHVAGRWLPSPGDSNRPPETGGHSRGGDRRPPWMRGMSDSEYKALAARRELHGLVLVMSTDNFRGLSTHDEWLRWVISFFAGISALGAGLAWRNIGRTAELQIRLVRASEQNAHLKELSLAAAGLAHETRNPLNIIRGQAQMLARAPAASPDMQEKARLIMAETDKVTAQLTEFINYSRPREVRRTKVWPAAIANEVARTLTFDLEEKKLRVEVGGEDLAVEADEQLLRQVLFNLLINAIQAADDSGRIKFHLARAEKGEAVLEVRDAGPGVPPENRREIFKPYFTTHQQGTGLGLAIVQQIVHAHGWEIECLGGEPRGAVFRIRHLKTAA
jgi:signal transduction histidine kinase